MPGTFQNTCGAKGARGVDEGSRRGMGPLIFSAQNSARMNPMMPQPTTEFTPSITVNAGLRVAKA